MTGKYCPRTKQDNCERTENKPNLKDCLRCLTPIKNCKHEELESVGEGWYRCRVCSVAFDHLPKGYSKEYCQPCAKKILRPQEEAAEV